MADVEQAVVKEVQTVGAKIWAWVTTAWGKVEAFFQFLDGPDHKFSHKRLLAVAFAVIAIRQFIIKDWFAGLLLLAASVVLAVVSALTKT